MRTFAIALAAVVWLSAGAAQAALNVSISSSTDLFALFPGHPDFSVDVTLSTTAPEALALGFRALWGPELELVSAVSDDDLQRVAADHLHDRGLTVGWFVPENGDDPARSSPKDS